MTCGLARQIIYSLLGVNSCRLVEETSRLVGDGVESLFDTVGPLRIFEDAWKEHGLKQVAHADRSMMRGSMSDFVCRSEEFRDRVHRSPICCKAIQESAVGNLGVTDEKRPIGQLALVDFVPLRQFEHTGLFTPSFIAKRVCLLNEFVLQDEVFGAVPQLLMKPTQHRM